jgi:hypothetical protein
VMMSWAFDGSIPVMGLNGVSLFLYFLTIPYCCM